MKNFGKHSWQICTTKSNLKSSAVVALFIALFVYLLMLPTAHISTENIVAKASGLEDKIDDDFIAFYEEKIAGAPIVSSMDKDTLKALQQEFDLTEKRLVLLLILDDFGKRTNNTKDFALLTKMTDKQLILYAKTLVDEFKQNLDDDEKEELKEQFLALVKRK
jgi:predicted protein tyrosine phosphatase